MKRMNKRAAAGAAVAGAALIAVSGVTAGTAEAGKLPGGFKQKNLGDGNSLSIRLYDESVQITRSVANNHFSREVFVSGKVRVTTAGDVKGGNINVGYLVGCQVTFGAGAGAEGGVEQGLTEGATPEPSLGADAGFKLGPGQAGYQPVISAKVGDDDEVTNSFNFGNARGGVAYSQERFGVDGCAGHASAVAKVTVRVATDTFKGNVTLYGKPFSLG
ncbi:hypothetical protein C6V83_05190 [Gordonia iterans]|uniref:Porin n=1 Tax=Gordonia iterans TaxID=1004901 RepID=A0A2S0KDJ0_9ACTN|nr:MspA family porin [Gordonia iterans]AVL99761.1 hypothetical protein C6V83_05190 [Gordonia iterans]